MATAGLALAQVAPAPVYTDVQPSPYYPQYAPQFAPQYAPYQAASPAVLDGSHTSGTASRAYPFSQKTN